MIHIPLILKLPGNRLAGSTVPYLARHLDVAPTICEILGLKPPDFMQGVPLLRGGALSNPKLDLVFSEEDFEATVVQSARGPEWKLQLANEANTRHLPPVELFDLQKSPREKDNLCLGETSRVADMQVWIMKMQEEARQAGEAYR